MEIPVQQMLKKIERELKEAGEISDPGRIRERIHAIKSICELILEHSGSKEMSSLQNAFISKNIREALPQVKPQQPKRSGIEDEANGDSIFDF